jgi:hypothetical protein
MVFLASCEFLLRQGRDWRKGVCFGLFSLHTFSRAISLARCLVLPF